MLKLLRYMSLVRTDKDNKKVRDALQKFTTDVEGFRRDHKERIRKILREIEQQKLRALKQKISS